MNNWSDSNKLAISNAKFCTKNPHFFMKFPEKSPWRCYLFGSADCGGIIWQPDLGGEPNWFWRKMQFLVFGNRWVKDESTSKAD